MNASGVTFVVTNLAIFLGYVFLAAVVVPRAAVRLHRTRIGGILFFFTCGLTHLEQVLHYFYTDNEYFKNLAVEWHMVAIHVVQAVAVWMFVTGLYIEMVKWGPWAASGKDDREEE